MVQPANRRLVTEDDLVGFIGSKAMAVSTDGSFDLPLPSNLGLEFVIVADVLDDIRMNGVSL